MTQLDHLKHARSLMNYANRSATLVLTKHKLGTPECVEAMQAKWQPKINKAQAYCREHNINGRSL